MTKIGKAWDIKFEKAKDSFQILGLYTIGLIALGLTELIIGPIDESIISRVETIYNRLISLKK